MLEELVALTGDEAAAARLRAKVNEKYMALQRVRWFSACGGGFDKRIGRATAGGESEKRGILFCFFSASASVRLVISSSVDALLW